MRLLKATEIARRAAQALSDSKKSVPRKKRPKRPEVEHGQRIFIFSHIQKKMVAYSLTRALNNNDTLRHMPYNGKKTVPAALRKDLWSPFATISFPKGAGPIGLSVFQKLREYRKRHEHEWGDEIMKNPENGYFIPKKKRGRLICDQVANSVADMAYVLGRLKAQDPTPTEGSQDSEPPKTPSAQPRKSSRKPQPVRLFPKPPRGGIGLVGEGIGLPVEIYWKDVKMAEYAETWTDNVVHGILAWHQNNRDNTIGNSKRKLLRMKEERAYLQRKKERAQLRKKNQLQSLSRKNFSKASGKEEPSKIAETVV